MNSDTHYENIRLDLGSPIASLTFARPHVNNAMTQAMGNEVEEAVRVLNGARHVRVVLLRGEGRIFSAGGDMGFIEDRVRDTPERNLVAMERFYRSYLSILDLRAPSIAVIQGAAIGAGLCFALAADIRIAGENAVFAANFVRLGLHPGMAATYLLRKTVGAARATEMLLTGSKIPADLAAQIGLVHSIHPEEKLESSARRLAKTVASNSPSAVEALKKTLRGAESRDLDETLLLEAEEQSHSYASKDLLEGIAAFRAKREPRFSG